MNMLRDKVVLITGGSAGIGLACGRAFGTAGAKVALLARGEERLTQAIQQLTATGRVAYGITADVGVLPECERALKVVIDHFGKLDILVNNAGLHHRGPFLANDADALADMIDVNLKSPIWLTRRALPELSRNRGAVINVASLAGCVPVPNSTVYSASKFGMRAFSLALGAELEDSGVTVSCVSPGPVDTGFIMDHLEQVSDITFSQPIVTADDVAAAVLACAIDGQAERKLPRASGVLATIGYVMPGLRRTLRTVLERRGRRVRQKLLADRAATNTPEAPQK
ncbi:MAG: SDR family oxidoreductase [Myxococcota bacterium]|nr:SDR family oxidoreductase [Myxococcota bacterium]